MATQLAVTPPLYGKDADDVWNQIRKAPDKGAIERLKQQLDADLQDIERKERL